MELRKILWGVLATTAMWSSAVFAVSAPELLGDGEGESLYIGIDGAYMKKLNVTSTTASTDSKKHVLGRAVIGYQMNENLAVEAGYNYFDKIDVNYAGIGACTGSPSTSCSTQVKIRGFDLVAKGMIPLDYNFGVFAEIGGTAFRTQETKDSTHEPTGALLIGSNNRIVSTVYGIGGSYDASGARIKAGWRRIKAQDNLPRLNMFYIGANLYMG